MDLLGCPVELIYRVRGSGCGVNALTLNGTEVMFDTEANPYRRGAALVAKAALLQRLQPSSNVLTIDIG